MKKQYPPPSYWQDFEDLCKQIFGEIWNCKHTIKKNGRIGQEQCGVDVYGFPDGGNDLYGVQCKGKDNNLGKGLTIKEIDEEITKASNFEPNLKVFIFATTAPKDSTIEKYILTKSIESKKNGNFEIILYDWDDLTDIIRRSRNLYNSYLSNQPFDDENKASVLFDNGLETLQVKFELKKTITHFVVPEPQPKSLYPEIQIAGLDWASNVKSIFGPDEYNQSWCTFKFRLLNEGNVAIEDWKLYFDFDNNTRYVSDGSPKGLSAVYYKEWFNYQTLYKTAKRQILYEHFDGKPIVPNDSRSDEISFLPKIDSNEVTVKWELLSRNLNTSGELKILLNTEFETEAKTENCVEKNDERTEEKISYLIKNMKTN